MEASGLVGGVGLASGVPGVGGGVGVGLASAMGVPGVIGVEGGALASGALGLGIRLGLLDSEHPSVSKVNMEMSRESRDMVRVCS